MKTGRLVPLLFALACLWGVPAVGSPGAVTGVVRGPDDHPVSGALVTARHRRLRRATTVYTRADGAFAIAAPAPGTYDLRVRAWGFNDLERRIEIGDAAVELELRLSPQTDPLERAWQLPANRWLPLLVRELSGDDAREEFVRQCTYCHQQGNWATRVPRDPEEWEKILKLMGRMGAILSPALRAQVPDAFNRAYADDNVLAAFRAGELQPPAPIPPEALTAVITEWDVGHPASTQHDIVVHPDGSVYSVDTNQDRLYRLDPETNERRAWAIPRQGLPLGGVFSDALVAPNSDAHVGPHSLQVAPDGSLWITLCLGNRLARFEPATERWDIFEQPEGLYPHTLRFDQKGRIWYTLAVSNHVGMIDPRTGERATIRLPARNWRQALALRLVPVFLWAAATFGVEDVPAGEGMTLPVPYGIDVAPDGGIWFSQLNERRIGRIDPETREIKIFDTPFPGPRRIRFDSRGRLWIPGFSAGLVARFDPSTGEYRTWDLPTGGIDTPYALNVDRRTDTVWICGTNSDTLIRFDPREERFTVYPLPTRVTYTREIDFDAAGNVWTSNSNFPSWQIEGSGPKLIRLEP